MSIVQIHFKNAFYMQQPKLLIHHPLVTHLDFKQALYVLFVCRQNIFVPIKKYNKTRRKHIKYVVISDKFIKYLYMIYYKAIPVILKRDFGISIKLSVKLLISVASNGQEVFLNYNFNIVPFLQWGNFDIWFDNGITAINCAFY